jgi:hypothetical protein
LPKGYTCNDDYQALSSIKNIHYFSILGTDIPGRESENEKCASSSYLCATKDCYNSLRNQDVYIDLGTFTNTWEEVVELIRKN